MEEKNVRLIIAGAGSRGGVYASFAVKHPERLTIVGIAEPRPEYRNRMAAEHRVPEDRCFRDWKEMASVPRFADAVVIATQDPMHAEPAIAFAEKGYQILLEKPMAPNEKDCERITEAATRNGILLAVGHVMRYTEYTAALKECIDSGLIGDIASVEHLEPVGYWHQAHSFVRGNWGNGAKSSSMLLAKSCHDLDWLRYIIGQPCRKVSSFGSLLHFRKEHKPQEAGDATRCVACAFEPSCPYSAKKIYLGRVRKGETGWPVSILTPDVTEASVLKALETGPYGRCVYECDNDAVDHQVVNMIFAGDITASFTMTAFTEAGHRKTRIFGTKGMIEGDGRFIRRFDFLSDTWHETDTESGDASITGGHGGGDYRLMDAFVHAVSTGDRSGILSGHHESLETHRMVFAAEESRREGRIVTL